MDIALIIFLILSFGFEYYILVCIDNVNKKIRLVLKLAMIIEAAGICLILWKIL